MSSNQSFSRKGFLISYRWYAPLPLLYAQVVGISLLQGHIAMWKNEFPHSVLWQQRTRWSPNYCHLIQSLNFRPILLVWSTGNELLSRADRSPGKNKVSPSSKCPKRCKQTRLFCSNKPPMLSASMSSHVSSRGENLPPILMNAMSPLFWKL